MFLCETLSHISLTQENYIFAVVGDMKRKVNIGMLSILLALVTKQDRSFLIATSRLM